MNTMMPDRPAAPDDIARSMRAIQVDAGRIREELLQLARLVDEFATRADQLRQALAERQPSTIFDEASEIVQRRLELAALPNRRGRETR